MRKSYFIVLACIVLAGCGSTQPKYGDAKLPIGEYKDPEYGYRLVLPPKIKYQAIGDDGPAFDTWNINKNPTSTDYSIWIHHIHSPSHSSDYFRTSCDDSVKEPIILEKSTDTYTLSGKFPGYPCSVDQCDDTKYGMSQYKGRYMFCSEHQDKTVLIELNQITDNPALAHQIFDTFRWTK